MMSAAAADAISSVTPMLASNRAPDNFGFARVAAISAARSGLRAKSTTSRPARAATPASAVPQAPAPITATELKDGIAWPQMRSLAPLLRGEGWGEGLFDPRLLKKYRARHPPPPPAQSAATPPPQPGGGRPRSRHETSFNVKI